MTKKQACISNLGEFEAHIKKKTNSGKPPGLSFVVIKNNQIKYSKGIGWADQPRKIAATPGTVYHWWSITKIITALSVIQLWEKGILQLDDPVIQHLSFFKVKNASYPDKAITIRHLLNHSSGLPDPGFRIVTWIHHEGEPAWNQTAFVKRILPGYTNLLFEPGHQARYTNNGYMILGSIIEKVTGQTFEDYVRQNILRPLGMNQTDFIYTRSMELNEATGSHPLISILTFIAPFFGRSYIRDITRQHIWFKRVYTNQTPPSGLIGPVTDAARLVMAYLNKGELEGKRILSEQYIDIMTYEGYMKGKKDDANNFCRQGIGWQISRNSGRLVVSHDGGGVGFYTKMHLLPEENLGFVLFTNDFTCKGLDIIELATTIEW